MDLHVMAPAMLALLDLTAEFIRALQQEKVRRNAADFSDQEHYAVELLLNADGSPTELARQIAESYVEIMVDEYQDTNEVQNCIFSAISRKGGTFYCGRRQAEHLSLPPGTAGDIPGEIPELLPRGLLLSQARPQDTAHPQFPVPAGGAGGYELHFSPYSLPADGGDGLRPGGAALSRRPIYRPPDRETELHLVSVENTEDEDFDRTRVEADFVAGMVRRMLDDGYPVQGEDGALRPVEPEDIVILMRSPRSRMADFRAALSRCGIPYSGGERESFSRPWRFPRSIHFADYRQSTAGCAPHCRAALTAAGLYAGSAGRYSQLWQRRFL